MIPASTLTRPPTRSTSSTRLSDSIRSIVPSVSAAGVNEWPEPATLTVRPSSEAATIAETMPSRVFGRAMSCGSQRSSRDQFRQR